jgi:hypothetical protein
MSDISNTNITTLTTNNTISDIMLKVNELVLELNSVHESLDFTPLSANTSEWLEGRVFYNQDEHTLSYYNDDPNIFVNTGQDIIIRVKNDKEINILKGDAIYIDGVADNIPSVDLAIANTIVSSSIVVGVAKGNIPANTIGYISLMGYVRGFDTSNFLKKDILYLSDTEVGGLTNVKPINKVSIKLGFVTQSDSSNGIIFVNTGSGSSLESYFTFDNPKEDDVLIHDGSNFTNDSKLNLTDGGNF